MRILLALLVFCLLVGAGEVPVVAGDDDRAFLLEYRRVHATGEVVTFKLEANGRATGTVRRPAAPGAAAEAPFEAWLAPEPSLRDRFDRASFWHVAGDEALGETTPGVRIVARLGSESHALSITESGLTARPELLACCDACEVLAGAGPVLAEGWRATGAACAAGGRWEAAIKAYRTGIERVPRVVATRAPTPGEMARLAEGGGKLEEAARLWGDALREEIELACTTLRQAELARFVPDLASWPEDWRPKWPWDWRKLPKEWVECVPAAAVGTTLRYAQPEAWAKMRPVAPGAGPGLLKGSDRIAYQPIQGRTEESAPAIELGTWQLKEDVSVQAEIERALAGEKAVIVRAAQYRRGALHHTDVVARAGDRAIRWMATQTEDRVALLRFAADVVTYRAVAEPLARLGAGLEPVPAGVRATVEAERRVTLSGDGGLGFDVPKDWREHRATDAPASMTAWDFGPPGDAPALRLSVPYQRDVKGFNWGSVWPTLSHPARKEAKPPAGAPTATEVVSNVRSEQAGWVEVRRSPMHFEGGDLPVYWFYRFKGDTVLVVLVVCGGDEPGVVARGRWRDRARGGEPALRPGAEWGAGDTPGRT